MVQATLNGWVEPAIAAISGDRRFKRRYEVRLPAEYRVVSGWNQVAGCGITRDLSSGGIAMEIDEVLPRGCQVEIAVQWPVSLEGGTPLKLVLRATVMRSDRRVAGLKVHRCQFRTQKRARAAGMAWR